LALIGATRQAQSKAAKEASNRTFSLVIMILHLPAFLQHESSRLPGLENFSVRK
jgi:hypothetical protein